MKWAFIVLFFAGCFLFPAKIWACESGQTCTVGEFLYDDFSAPISTATCTITSHSPNGELFLIATPSATVDGWYAHSFTASSITGTYRTQLCCDADSQHLCIDKSFNVSAPIPVADIPTAEEIAAATWGYSGRSLTTFGNLVADIWKSKSVTSLQTNNEETRNLLEQIVNKPVVETTMEDVPNLESKIRETESITNQLFSNTQYAKSKVDLVALKWDSLTSDEVWETVRELSQKNGGENDASSTDSVFGQTAFLKESWDWNFLTNIKSQVKAISEVLAILNSEIPSSGRSKLAYNEVKTLSTLLGQLEILVGVSADKSSQNTLFGKTKEVKLLAEAFSSRSQEAESLIAKWDLYSLKERQTKLEELSKSVAAVNRISGVNKILLSGYPFSEKDMKNRGFYMSGILAANTKLLASKNGAPLFNTWLELGSVVFKSLISNPSALISQKVAVNYYLPAEVSKEDVIETDEGLTVKFDSNKNQYFVSGDFVLAPSQTKTVSVRCNDIWTISQEQVDSLRKQAEALSRPLEKTSYFAQGVTIKSDVDVSLDKVLALMKANSTPENKIKAYREAEIEMKAVKVKIEKLKELATQAGSSGSLLGFVGGAQVLAVWGLILIFVVGFIFLAVYMRMLVKKEEISLPKKPRSGVGVMAAVLLLGLGLGLGVGVVFSPRLASTTSQVLGTMTLNK